ncbi:MAG: hypothetical protein LBI03_05910 [Clostridiales bacterium]|nr:hypothetical protein [Clostridiales bacterium]
MKVDITSDLIICVMITGIFIITLCVLVFIFEHVIPEKITDKIIEVLFGEVPDDFDE